MGKRKQSAGKIKHAIQENGKTDLTFRRLVQGDAAGYRKAVLRLWPHSTAAEIKSQFRRNCEGRTQVAFVCADGARLIGFADASLRREYVEGAGKPPVGYLEGLWVDSAYRKRGVARRLCAAAGAWAKARGCREMASDTPSANGRSIAFHKAIGFREANRIVCFLKKIYSKENSFLFH